MDTKGNLRMTGRVSAPMEERKTFRWRAAILGMGLMLLACQEPPPMADGDAERDAPAVRTGDGSGVLLPGHALPGFPGGDSAGRNSGPEGPINPASTPAPAPDLALMTFNIRYANPADGTNIWANRRAQVYSLIKSQDPDVAGLQEVLHAQLLDLQANLPAYASLGVGRDDGRTAGEYSPVFYRSARYRADTSGTFWFSDTPAVPGSKHWGNTIPRICTWARLVDKISGKGFYLFNVHLDHESQPSREKSVQLVVDRIGQVKNPSEPVFITGDFNVGESDPAIRYLKGKATLAGKANPVPFLDSFRMVDSTSTAVATWHDWSGDTSGDKIDYILVLPRIKALSAAIVRSNQAGKYPSDHFPVTASLTVPDWASTSIRRSW